MQNQTQKNEIEKPKNYFNFWKQVNILMKINKINISSLSKKIGISRTTLSFWKKNNACPTADAYIKLCCLLGVFSNSYQEKLFQEEKRLPFLLNVQKIKKLNMLSLIMKRTNKYVSLKNIEQLDDYSRLLELKETIIK